MREGSGRNATMFHALCKVARYLPPGLDAFVDWAREYNGKFGEPMTDAEVFDTAKSVFGYVERGELRTGEHGAWFVHRQAQELARDPYLFALIAWLKAENGSESEFWFADGLCSPKYLDWPPPLANQATSNRFEIGRTMPAHGEAVIRKPTVVIGFHNPPWERVPRINP